MESQMFESEFFTMLKESADIVLAAGEAYSQVMTSYPDAAAPIARLEELETAADLQTQKIMERINTSTNTPLDRQDLSRLALGLDGIVDRANNMVASFDMYNCTEVRAEVGILSEIVNKMCQEIQTMVYLLSSKVQMRDALELAIEIDDIESLGDDTYRAALYRLFHEDTTDREQLVWSRIFDSMEGVIDECNAVASTVRTIVNKSI